MIGWLRGRVAERTATTVLIDVQGVGYTVKVSIQNPIRAGEQAELFIHTHVREDAIHLFGFADRREMQLFDLLIGVPNIGPVKAMQILQTPVDDVLQMAAERDAARLAKLPGVGKKTAERILVDVADKLERIEGRGPVPAPPARGGIREDLVSALINLGYRDTAADEAATLAMERLGADHPIQDLVREALVALRPGTSKERA